MQWEDCSPDGARVTPHQVIHCDILQLCGPNNVNKPASMVVNGQKHTISYDKQLFYNFRLFAERMNCKLVRRSEYYIDQDDYWKIFKDNHVDIPFIQTTHEELKNDALQTHKLLYGLPALYPDEVSWLYADESLSLDMINKFVYKEVDRERLRNDKSFIVIFQDMLRLGIKRQEIECSKKEAVVA